MSPVFAVLDILTSDGKYAGRAKHATHEHQVNAAVLCARLNLLFGDLGISKRPPITSGFRVVPGIGAQKSAHLEGKAVDFLDPNFAIAHRITRQLLAKHGLRREDTDYTSSVDTKGRLSEWCHLDTRLPFGIVFKP